MESAPQQQDIPEPKPSAQKGQPYISGGIRYMAIPNRRLPLEFILFMRVASVFTVFKIRYIVCALQARNIFPSLFLNRE